jgi:hypothetical protein
MEQRTIILNDYLQDVLDQLHTAELRLAELRGQRDLLLRMMQPPVRTDGEENSHATDDP